ncbi:hypothetical protein BCR34DRAFT_475291 [Clohesyomyces aquaticus]|uniref:PH domain-containing protein n=1 Tax=Clohesyomyces aquaticus TaxID=1231657 RepID=A0A1Y2A3K1_9PLEO|nr:hypothetical protein BCR34DRAFT_475291 [Clohesyomyces aquaticus]
MTQLVVKYAAKKLMSKEMDKYKSKDVTSYDPFYEEIPHPTKRGKTKKVKKQIPAYIPTKDAEILAKARKRAYMLDVCLFNFLGIRFGWSAVIGLVPAVGDFFDAFLAYRLISAMSAVECGLGGVQHRMYLNLIFDFFVGLIPFVGDLADAAMKANSRNVRLLEKRLDEAYKPNGVEPDAPATVYEDFSDEEEERRGSPYDATHGDVRRPMRAQSGRKERVRDEEMGLPRYEEPRSGRHEKPVRNGTKSSRR